VILPPNKVIKLDGLQLPLIGLYQASAIGTQEGAVQIAEIS
jgi:hypothetical protein